MLLATRLLSPFHRRLLRNNLVHLTGEHLEPVPQQIVLNRQLAHLIGLFDFPLVLGLILPCLLSLLYFPESLVLIACCVEIVNMILDVAA